ncbi:hypothetical protein MHK_003925 [Candidatus Magnetomorum sp. HK-1]|nr:hypothetical protein MHK_003925 [Candidatus Magnetomorum sp. HK-1]
MKTQISQKRNSQHPFGKQIEINIIKSLKLAGFKIKTSANLDHNYKIDFILTLGEQRVGIQFSLKQDNIKAKASKICALDEVRRFIYLNLDDQFFQTPDKNNGAELFRLLKYIVEEYRQKALWLNVDMSGWRIKTL